jgi:hypothetical protein
MYRGVFVTLLLLVVGCTGGPLSTLSSEASKTIAGARTVGVISAVGHTFALQKIGITVFGNELKEVPIGSWGIDDAVASRVGAVLSPRYKVKRIAVPQGMFAAYEKPAAFSSSDAELQGIVRRLAASQGCDLVIVVTRSGISWGSSNQVVVGLGLLEAGGLINAGNVTLFAVTAVSLYDGRTFERLTWQRPQFQIGGSMMGGINGPHRTLERSWWPATPQAVHNDKLKSATRALVEQSVAATIPRVMGTAKQAKAE